MLLKRLDDDPNFCHTTITYNAVIKALGSRRDYSEEALEFYQKMALQGVNMDMDTFVHTLKACASGGDVKTAYNVLQTMRQKQFKPNKYIYNQMLRVYAGACQLSDMREETIDLYLKDAWALFEQIRSENLLN